MKPIRFYWLLGLLASGVAFASDVVPRDAWVREAPPGATVMAAYMTLNNAGGQPRVLVAARADGFERVELHETVNESGRAVMRAVPALTIPAKGNVALAPGGYHLMLIRPKRAFRAGASVSLELRFADGGTVNLKAPVKAGDSHDNHHHH